MLNGFNQHHNVFVIDSDLYKASVAYAKHGMLLRDSMTG